MLERITPYLTLHVSFVLTFQILDHSVYDHQFAKRAFRHAAAAYSRDPLKCIGIYKMTYVVQQDEVRCDHFHDKV